MESQDSLDKFFKVENGKPTIDTYDTKARIILNENTIKTNATTDVLYANILSAKDADGIQYLFNPDIGWFKVPEVQMDYTKLEAYTPVTEDYFTDGRFALVSAFKYAENPTIDVNAPIPQFWVNFGNSGNSDYVDICMTPHTSPARGQIDWPTLRRKPVDNKSFVWSGFYKVFYDNNGVEDYYYVVGRTIKTDKEQTQSFAYGISRAEYERRANNILPDGTTELQLMFDLTNKGGKDFTMILAPPDDSNFSWNPDLVHIGFSPDPVIAGLQKRGELISLFDPEDQQTILKVLNQTPVPYSDNGYIFPLWSAPINNIPPELSKHILLTGRG